MTDAMNKSDSIGPFRYLRYFLLLSVLAVSGCGGGDSGDDNDDETAGAAPTALDVDIGHMAQMMSLTGDPASVRGLERTPPDESDRVKLGQILFFSQTLAAGYDVSCGTCHHPDFAGSDGLSIGVGVVPEAASVVGPGRRVDDGRDLDPQADGGPNMHRNSMTTFNAALFDRVLMFDGRVSVLDEETVAGGHGQAIRTPESGRVADATDADGLMEHTMKGPIVNDNEMRGFLYTNLDTPVGYRAHLVARLRGEADAEDLDPGAADNWLALFRSAFDQPAGSAGELITMLNVQRALAAYIQSQVFVDTPWRDYLDGDMDAISEDAKKGAMLFFEDEAGGGLGCASCHGGDKFSDEGFHNVGFPQIGRGFGRSNREDLGRWTQTQAPEDLYAFRTPSLLNVAETAPYGHAGTFATLADVIDYHADPRGQVDLFDFSLQQLDQFRNTGLVYDYAEPHTRAAIGSGSFAAAEGRLPGRPLSQSETDRLVAFLESLTDRCVADSGCVDDWAPAASEDPDGHLLVRGQPTSIPDTGDVESPDDYPQSIALDFPGLAVRGTFADVEGCADNLDTGGGSGSGSFALRSTDPDFGLNDPHGFSQGTWYYADSSQMDSVMIAGGVSAGYLDDDCWPDLVFAGGDDSGMRFYENLSGSGFRAMENVLADNPGTRFTGAALADLDGDYRRELLFGNLRGGTELPIYAATGGGQYARIAGLPMGRHTYGISFAPLDDSGHPYFYTAHWAVGSGTNGGSPALWKNDGERVRPWDEPAQTTSAYVDQRFNFTPKFADFTGDGRQDLVVASDFNTSSMLVNRPDGEGGFVFENVTDRDVITDQNGMGAALLDRNNDGVLEWFVTSIFASEDSAVGSWGKTGNRLYEQVGTGGELRFEDITEEAGVRDGYWGWGACAADFDNDGFTDIFHVNGFGHVPEDVDNGDAKAQFDRQYKGVFVDTSSRLFMNDGDGTFTERAENWNIDKPSEGRGVVCFDYDRDGDMDIVLLDHSTGLQFFENDIGHDDGHHFLSIRLVGASPNTDAIGAKVHVTANVDGQDNQTMLRLSEANSNFNSQNPPDLHFGLGEAEVASIGVVWPNGERTDCLTVAVNQFLVLDQRVVGPDACPAASE